MWIENEVFNEDLDNLRLTSFIPWDNFKGKNIFITGATGLIGFNLASALLYYEKKNPTGLKVTVLVRNKAKAEQMFKQHIADNCSPYFIEGSVESFPFIKNIDYIIHCACPTGSNYFVSNPVETMNSILQGTKNILELAKIENVEGVVYLSSMEVYGEISERFPLKEYDIGYISPFSPRSSYPIGKRAAETLCYSYYKQYGVPVAIARLAQTFGPGVDIINDNRVFAYMARCAIKGEDICLNTDGSKENMYLYTADAISAILLLLAKAEYGNAYNVANTETYCSIKEMGNLVQRSIGRKNRTVKTCVLNEKATTNIYRPNSYLMLDTSKLQQLGWRANTNLENMYIRMTNGYIKNTN